MTTTPANRGRQLPTGRGTRNRRDREVFAREEPLAAPRHLGLIMDGNGRWARARGLPRAAGHRHGVEALRRSVGAAAKLGLRYLTVYGFSPENWRRPPEEVGHLMTLLRRFLHSEVESLQHQGVRLRTLGDRERLPPDVVDLLAEAEAATAGEGRLDLIVALSYGGRQELTAAARRLAAAALAGALAPEQIDEACFRGALQLPDVPDPDLIIRTSGERRLSNFLLWQAAHSDLIFVDCLWPDFGEPELAAALELYRQRHAGRAFPTGPRAGGLDHVARLRDGTG
ncbi:MAG: polyprenyl diphosphate synthase [Kiloniellales bacterium]|nr:polyprenyl diphosphate synthase [Kiloniellales bacterium]